MFCKNCGEQITDGALFCTNCGASVAEPPVQPAQQPVAPAYQQPVYSSPYTNNRYINSLFPIPAEVWA